MDEAPILGSDREQKIFNQVVSLYDAPAYIRRAQTVQAAWDGILDQCRQQRAKWLALVRTRLAVLRALAGEWDALQGDWVSAEGRAVLAALEADVRPTLRQTLERTPSPRRLRSALTELRESIAYFNTRWTAYLAGIDLTAVNRLREGYNRFYVLEKECAVRSAAIARQGFERLPPATLRDLTTHFPALPMP